MKSSLAAVAVSVALLSACAAPEPPTAAQSAATACAEVSDLLARPALRMADVARLARAQQAADDAARSDAQWEVRAAAVRALRAAATDVAASAQQATSNTTQHQINVTFVAAKERTSAVC